MDTGSRENDWITTAEASDIAGYHVEHIRRILRTGDLHGRKWGREWMVNYQSLLDYLKKIDEAGDRRGPKLEKTKKDLS